MTEKSVDVARRPRRRRKDHRPSEIIEAGLAEFGACGFEAARMEDVARRAGVAKGTVFRYFSTKEALFEAAVATRVGPLWAAADPIADGDGAVLPLILRMVETLYAGMTRPEMLGLMRIIVGEGPRFPEVIEAWHRHSIARAQGLLGGLVARAVERGEIRPGALTELPMVLMGPGVMAALWQITFNGLQPIPPECFRAAHLDLLDRALGRTRD